MQDDQYWYPPEPLPDVLEHIKKLYHELLLEFHSRELLPPVRDYLSTKHGLDVKDATRLICDVLSFQGRFASFKGLIAIADASKIKLQDATEYLQYLKGLCLDPHFEQLGLLRCVIHILTSSDANDKQVQWAYTCCIKDEPKSVPFYLDSLLEVTKTMKSEFLDEFTVMERSKGGLTKGAQVKKESRRRRSSCLHTSAWELQKLSRIWN